jgi:hypothetical protein
VYECYAIFNEIVAGGKLMPGDIAVIHAYGTKIDFQPHLHFLVTEGGHDFFGPQPGLLVQTYLRSREGNRA